MPKSIPVPPQRHRAAAFFNKNTRQVRGKSGRTRACMHMRHRKSMQTGRSHREMLTREKKRRGADFASHICHRLPSAGINLAFPCCPSFISPSFLRQRELSNVTFVRRERATAANKDWPPIRVRPVRPRGRELQSLMAEGGKRSLEWIFDPGMNSNDLISSV